MVVVPVVVLRGNPHSPPPWVETRREGSCHTLGGGDDEVVVEDLDLPTSRDPGSGRLAAGPGTASRVDASGCPTWRCFTHLSAATLLFLTVLMLTAKCLCVARYRGFYFL